MNKIKNILSVVLWLALPLAFSACGDDLEYTPAEKLTNAQVYFSTALAAQVDLDNDATSFDIELSRAKTDEEIIVPLNVTNSSGLFTVPSSAKFAAGESATKITINYDPEELGFDNYKEIGIALNDEAHTTPYGTANYIFKAGIPSPWRSLGKATFTDAYLFENYYQVELQQNELQPAMYRLVDPYSEGLKAEDFETQGAQSPYLVFTLLQKGNKLNDIEITKDGLVHFQSACTGFFNTSNGYNKNVDIHHPSDFTNFQSEDKWLYSKVKVAKDDGSPAVVQLAAYYYMDGLGGWDKTQMDGLITIIFPGVVIKDYSAKVAYQGRFTNVGGDNFAVANITLGSDVENAKVAMIEGENIEGALAGILDGSIETMEVTASGTVNIPGSYNGLCSIVAVTYAEGEAQELGYTSFEFSAGTDKWESLGMATYTDDYIASMYNGVEPVSYEVEVQANTEEIGMYRLVNPYGAAYPYNEEGDWDDSKNYYMVINAQDPQGVYIDLQDTGLDWGEGNISVFSLAGYYLSQGNSLADIKAENLCGSLVDGVITFPAESLVVAFEGDNKLYTANANGAFKVVLPGAVKAKAMKTAPLMTPFKKGRLITTNRISEKQLQQSFVTSKVQSFK